jgi:hypothetical protein
MNLGIWLSHLEKRPGARDEAAILAAAAASVIGQ